MSNKIKNSAVIAELKHIAEENERGVLLPEEVVHAAAPVTSPLHRYFTWDDTAAAQKCRLQEARQLINVCVEYIGGEQEGRETRVFVSLRDERVEGGYRPLVKVLQNPSQRESLIADALEEMGYFRQKYRSLKELAQVFRAMDHVEHLLASDEAGESGPANPSQPEAQA